MAHSVVLVEDDESTVGVVSVALEALGCKVRVASDGETGLDLIRRTQPDLILLDIMMPRMNGYELCARIQQDPDLGRTPIVVITGITDNQDQEAEAQWRERLAVADFITKPFQVEDLQERVRRILPD